MIIPYHQICGLKLPDRLSWLISTDQWCVPTDLKAFADLTKFEYLQYITFFNVASMERETKGLKEIANSEHSDFYGVKSSKLLGKPISDPEIIDADLSILFAANYDEEALFLDYRNGNSPAVLATQYDEINVWVRHKTIALSFDEFADTIGLPSMQL